jgi:hypothetical protein
MKKRVFMVMAMARCGTSTIARGLSAIGVDLGNSLLPADRRNPKGFFEDIDVTFKINRGLLRLLNYSWTTAELAHHMELQDHPQLNKFKDYAVRLVQTRLTHTECWGFKDTNTSLLLPFWQSVLRAADVEENYIIALRNPLGCAYSNIKHSRLPLEAGLFEWLRNMIHAIGGTHGKQRIVVSYDLMLEDPLQELVRMRQHLNVTMTSQSELNTFASKFVDKRLHHHVYSDADLVNDRAMAAIPVCLPAYKLLMRVAQDELSMEDAEFLQEWQCIENEFYKYYPLYEYAVCIQKENHLLEREIRIIRKSVPWKLLYPVRLLLGLMRGQKAAQFAVDPQ